MALTGKLEAVVEIQSTSDKFFSVLSTENHQVPDASSEKVHGVEVHEGDWKTTGSVKLWKYVVEGEVEVMKEKVEVDDENKLVILTALEGHCLNLYKTYKIIFQVTPMTEGGSVKITVEYEKLSESIPPPNVEVEMKSPADEFYNILKSKIQHLPTISSDKVHGVEVHKGDWETSGSVKLWKFTVGWTLEMAKRLISKIKASARMH